MSNIPQNQGSLSEKLKATVDSYNSDKNYNIGEALVSFIPGVGSLVVPFYKNYIVSPATQRMNEFLGILVQELEKLESKIELVDIESPVFVTTLLQACHIAIRTHKKQKLEALKNVVLNSSIPSSLEDDILAMFLNWIDDFTELHISILNHFHYLNRYAPEELRTYFPMLEQNKAIYNQVLKDLADKGLIKLLESYHTLEEDNGDPDEDYYDEDGVYSRMRTHKYQEDIESILEENDKFTLTSKSTELGKQFIKFIENPSIETEPR